MILSGQHAAQWLEQEASSLGVSVSRLCREAQINRSTVQRWKQGLTEPNMFSIRRFKDILQRRKNFLEGGRDR